MDNWTKTDFFVDLPLNSTAQLFADKIGNCILWHTKELLSYPIHFENNE